MSASLKVALVTGRTELGCGVADYSVRLAESLEEAGTKVALVTRDHWGPRTPAEVRHELAALRADIVHLQYPTASYRTSLAPHALSMAQSGLVLTLHEASQAHPLRQLSLLALVTRPRAVVFTSTYERDHVARLAPWVRRRAEVIPIGSAIPLREPSSAPEPRIVYFGLLTPEKGLDDVLALARLAATRPGVRVLVVGRAESRYPGLADELASRGAGLPLDLAIDRSADEVADLLAASAAGYLPFPDGASERRSSLLALLGNGVPTVTTPGPYVDDELSAAVRLADAPEAAWAEIETWLMDDRARQTAVGAARRYGVARDWSQIASRHLELYERISGRERPIPRASFEAAESAGSFEA